MCSSNCVHLLGCISSRKYNRQGETVRAGSPTGWVQWISDEQKAGWLMKDVNMSMLFLHRSLLSLSPSSTPLPSSSKTNGAFPPVPHHPATMFTLHSTGARTQTYVHTQLGETCLMEQYNEQIR